MATAKRKLEKLDVAYVKKRIELTRILDDFQHLAEVKTQLTARVGELTEQIQQAKRLQGISEELFPGSSQGGKRRLVPKPPPCRRQEARGQQLRQELQQQHGTADPVRAQRVARRVEWSLNPPAWGGAVGPV